jgi:hypothetical protein
MFEYNRYYLMKNGKPWFPVMGEIHYSRLPKPEWRDAILKMKAGGIQILSSYVIWIHHEEIEGVWETDGNRDLRGFLEAVRDSGLFMILRIGPWVHGEVRNGGFPDWLLRKEFVPRTNDERYFAQARRFYRHVFQEAKGLLHKDGGPVIGVQIENEYGHCGGLGGEEGEAHMRRMTEIAKEEGFDVPFYTATGWGGAVTGGLLPVMGGYCDAPWDSSLAEIAPSGNFVFSYERNDHDIGSDYAQGEHLTFDPEDFPYLTAELGGGLQVTAHRRPVAQAADVAAMSVVKVGSGAAMLGYYMYHGGVNPDGRLSTLQESRETGYPNDLPVKSYDFRAPLGAYGQENAAFHELRGLAMFLADFGEELCRMKAVLPPQNPSDPADVTRLRHSFRHNGEWGFLFFNNYVRRRRPPDFRNVSLTVPGLGRRLPEFDVLSGEYGFYPFDMPVEGGKILFAQAQPLCVVGKTTILSGKPPVTAGKPDILVISPDEARNAYKIRLEMEGNRSTEEGCSTEGSHSIEGSCCREYLVICGGVVVQDRNEVHILTQGDGTGTNIALKIFPEPRTPPRDFAYLGREGAFTVYRKRLPQEEASCEIEKTGGGRFRLVFSGLDAQAQDYALRLRYRAERAAAYLDGRLIMDDFFADGNWYLGLKRHGFPSAMDLLLAPLTQDMPLYLENWPELENGKANFLDEARLSRVWKVRVF